MLKVKKKILNRFSKHGTAMIRFPGAFCLSDFPVFSNDNHRCFIPHFKVIYLLTYKTRLLIVQLQIINVSSKVISDNHYADGMMTGMNFSNHFLLNIHLKFILWIKYIEENCQSVKGYGSEPMKLFLPLPTSLLSTWLPTSRTSTARCCK